MEVLFLLGFWIYMLIIALLIPFTMVGFGKYFSKTAPKNINTVFGYRTSMSMKNKDTWNFAHKYCGKIWFVSGLILLPLSVGAMILVIGGSENVVGTVGATLCGIQIVPMIVSVILTEKALNKNFDKNGIKR